MSKKNIKIGDKVSVISDTISGIVMKIGQNEVVIQSEDGFTYNCEIKDIVKRGDLHDLINNENHDEFLRENFTDKKKTVLKKFSKKNKVPPMEVDLHINQLVNNCVGMSNFDMLDLQMSTAKRKLEFAINNKIQKVVFIHGVGAGVLKNELHFLFKKYAVKSYEASPQNYGEGATEVYIYQNSKTS